MFDRSFHERFMFQNLTLEKNMVYNLLKIIIESDEHYFTFNGSMNLYNLITPTNIQFVKNFLYVTDTTSYLKLYFDCVPKSNKVKYIEKVKYINLQDTGDKEFDFPHDTPIGARIKILINHTNYKDIIINDDKTICCCMMPMETWISYKETITIKVLETPKKNKDDCGPEIFQFGIVAYI